jgi:hypothetical protein
VINNSLMSKEKTYWSIEAKIRDSDVVTYHDVEDPTVDLAGVLAFLDPDTGLRVWVGPGARWIATEHKSKRTKRGR